MANWSFHSLSSELSFGDFWQGPWPRKSGEELPVEWKQAPVIENPLAFFSEPRGILDFKNPTPWKSILIGGGTFGREFVVNCPEDKSPA